MSQFMVPARDLTPEEAEERAEKCYALEEKVKTNLRVGRESLWEVAQALYEFDESNGWSALGYDKLNDWLAQPDIGISRSHYFRLVSVYHEMVVLRQVDAERLKEIEPQKIQIVLPAVKSGKVQLEEALDDAEALGRRDLRERYFKRPDPGEEYNQSRKDEGDGIEVVEAEVVMNPTDDTPVWAGDVDESEPAQNGNNATRGRIEEVVNLLNIGLSYEATDDDKVQAMGQALALLIEMFPEAAGAD